MNILLTSAGRRSYLVQYFKEALGSDGEVHATNSEWSTALHFADKAVISPLIYDDSYIQFLLEYCKSNDIKILIPLFDIDLPILSLNKHLFERIGVNVIVSSFKVTDTCNDKWKSYQFFKKHNINTPKSYLLIQDAVKEISNQSLLFPVIIKPRWGMGSLGIYQADNLTELEVLYKKVKNEINSSYLKYEASKNINKAVIIQEKIIGNEYGLDVINDLKSKYVITSVKRKIAMRSGETDQAVTEKNYILEKLGKKISMNLKHIGNLDVDCFLVNNEPFVLEMNARFGGGYPFSHIAGINLPKAIIKWVQNEKPNTNFFKFLDGYKAAKNITIIGVDK